MTTIKKHDSTYFVENNWTDKEGKEQTATVRLEINYSNKSCSIKPEISDRFVFVNSDLNKWIAVANCIRNAAEFAKIELEEKEESYLTKQRNMFVNDFNRDFAECILAGERNVYNHEGPEMEAKLSNDKVLPGLFTVHITPDSIDKIGKYPFDGDLKVANYAEALNVFQEFVKERVKIGDINNGEFLWLIFSAQNSWEITRVPLITDILIAKYEHIK